MYQVRKLNFCPVINNIVFQGIAAVRPDSFEITLDVIVDDSGNFNPALFLDDEQGENYMLVFTALLTGRKRPEVFIHSDCFLDDTGGNLMPANQVLGTAIAMAIVDTQIPKVRIYLEGNDLVFELSFGTFCEKQAVPINEVSAFLRLEREAEEAARRRRTEELREIAEDAREDCN